VLGGALWDTANSSQSNLKDSGCRRDSRKDDLRERWEEKTTNVHYEGKHIKSGSTNIKGSISIQ
jgi:hypothetical protein